MKIRIPGMGTAVDAQRRGHIREDTHRFRRTIARIRQWIFEKGIGVDSTRISDVLDATSLLPTKVSFVPL